MTPFGTTRDGRAVHAVEIATGDLSVRILTYGAILQDVRLAGVDHGLTLGSDAMSDYEGTLAYFGPIIGPVVNRLTGAKAPIGGLRYQFAANAPGGHLLHSGPGGTIDRIWDVAEVGPTHATLTVTLPDGACAMPGNRRITARFEVAGTTLRLALSATTDETTLMSLANHSYWTLDGGPGWAGHHLRVAADRVLPTDENAAPTGEIADVAGTPFDFRDGREIAPGAPPLDHNLCLSDHSVPLRDVLWLTGRTGLRMTLATTAPGVQIYDQRAPNRPGRGAYEGLAIEPQHWPDAPNNPRFPSIELAPEETWTQTTEWRFLRA